MPRPSDPKKLALWRQRFERFSNSRLAVAPFCDREGVSVASFYHWRKKLGHNGRRRRVTDGHPRCRGGLAGERGAFRQVAVVRRRFELWRGTRRGRGRIPERLWTSAVKLAATYGLCRTARTLRLDYNAPRR